MRKFLLLPFILASVVSAYGADVSLTEVPFGQDSAETKMEDSITNESLIERLNYLEKVLYHNECKASQWWKTWTVVYGVATVGQGTVAVVLNDKSTRQDMILGAGTTTLGVLSQLVTPVSSGFKAIGPDSVASLTLSAKQRLLKEDEALLQKQADIAKAGKSWQTHALSGAVNLASGLITWIGFKRPFSEGVLNFALNTVVTEVQIWTQPVWAQRNYKKVRWNLHEEGFRTNSDRIPEWYGCTGPTGVCVGLRF